MNKKIKQFDRKQYKIPLTKMKPVEKVPADESSLEESKTNKIEIQIPNFHSILYQNKE